MKKRKKRFSKLIRKAHKKLRKTKERRKRKQEKKVMVEKKIFFYNEEQKIAGIIHLPKGKRRGAVVLAHGFLSNKEAGGMFSKIARELCKNGFLVLRFDFRSCGESEGTLYDLTIERMSSDLNAAVSFVKSWCPDCKVGVVGLSLSGILSLVAYMKQPQEISSIFWINPAVFIKEILNKLLNTNNIPVLTFLAAMNPLLLATKSFKHIKKLIKNKDFAKFSLNIIKELRSEFERKSFIMLSLFHPRFKLSINAYKGAQKFSMKTMSKVLEKIECPVMIVQSDKDNVVSPVFTRVVFDKIKTKKKIVFLKNTSHFLNENKQKFVAKLAKNWFEKTLK